MRHHTMTSHMLFASLTLASCAVAPAFAEDGDVTLEEIIVTAERRSEDLQKTALSITALTADDLAAQDRDNIRDILQVVPGVVVQEGTFGPTVSMRGIATTATNADSASTTYVDGVALLGNGNHYYDISRVEVLRGPQGTLYGKNSSAGVVNVVTADPTQDLEAMGAIELGNYSLVQTSGMVNLPLSDTLALRASFTTRDRDGFLSSGQNDLDDKNLRVKLAYTPSGDFSALFAGTVYKDDSVNGGQVAGSTTTALSYDTTNPNGYSHTNYYNLYSHLNWNLGFGSLTVIPAYQHQSNSYSKYVNNNANSGTRPTNAEASSLETRLASNDTGPLSWVVGLYGYRESNMNSQTLNFSSTSYGIYNDNLKSTSLGAFGESTYSITDTFRLTGGLRYTQDRRDNTQDIYTSSTGLWVPYAFKKNFSSTDYKVRAEYDVAENNLLYAGVSSGYRAGGYGTQGASYAAEDLTAYTVGSKNRFFNDRVELNAEAYYYDYSGFQITDPVFVGSQISTFNVLVLPATFKGIDLESKLLITDSDRINLSASYESGKFDANAMASTILPSSGVSALTSFGSNQTPFTPEWTLLGGYEHSFQLSNGGNITAGANGTYRADQYLANVQQPLSLQKAFTLWDASVGYSSADKKLSINTYVKNLTNEIYQISTQVRNLTATSSNVILGTPRTYGIALTVRM